LQNVSILSNRDLKQELNQAAKVAIADDPEIRAYAEQTKKQMLASCFKQRKVQTNPSNVLFNKERGNVH
jgi:transposase